MSCWETMTWSTALLTSTRAQVGLTARPSVILANKLERCINNYMFSAFRAVHCLLQSWGHIALQSDRLCSGKRFFFKVLDNFIICSSLNDKGFINWMTVFMKSKGFLTLMKMLNESSWSPFFIKIFAPTVMCSSISSRAVTVCPALGMQWLWISWPILMFFISYYSLLCARESKKSWWSKKSEMNVVSPAIQ